MVWSTVVAYGGQLEFVGDADWKVKELEPVEYVCPLAGFGTVG